MIMMAPNPTPKTTTPPPSSTSPTVGGSKPMVPHSQDQQQTPSPLPGPLNCPRCDSSNTKFCYYNNYSLSQPRHFCKACKRYWTRGGTLRNVPVGGGCRKKKRASRKHQNAQAEASSASLATKNHNPNHPHINLPTTSSSELCSLIHASFLTAAAYDDDDNNNNNIRGLVIPSSQFSSGLINLHQTSANFLSNEYPSFKFGSQDVASLMLQDCTNASLGFKNVKVEGIESVNNGNDIQLWQGNYPFDQALNVVASDSSYTYWNPPMGATCWPDVPADSSVAPLI